MLVWLLIACTGCAGSDPPAAEGLAESWIQELVQEPQRFAETVGENRDGWIALHRNDWIAAMGAGGVPATRATVELSRFYAVLSGLSNRSWLTLAERLPKRGQIAPDSLYPLFFRFAADLSGREAEARSWQDLAVRSSDPRVARIAGNWAGVRPPSAAPAEDELSGRMAIHRAMREGAGDLATFRSVASQPLVVEPVPGASRELYDPLVYETLRIATERPLATPLSGLPAELFSGSLAGKTSEQLLAQLGGSLPATDDDTACRDAVRAADVRIDAWERQLSALPGDEGHSLLADLELIRGFRSRWLVDLAVSVVEDRPACALALASLATDYEQGRKIGPINSPTLFAVTASARFRLGDVREAKDALRALVLAFPEVVAVDETIGDLAVLDGMGRIGDSREH